MHCLCEMKLFLHNVVCFVQNMIGQYITLLVKWFWYKYTGKTFLERTLTGGAHNYYMTDCVAQAIFESRMLQESGVVGSIKSCSPFSVNYVLTNIVTTKRIKRSASFPLLERNLRLCLINLNGTNVAVQILRDMKTQTFVNEIHEAELFDLWNVMKPQDTLPGRICTEWNQIGFQGTDPSTDFRGMGYLGLYSLLQFARSDPAQARIFLKKSLGPVGNTMKFYPFSCCGIQIGFFLSQLIEERKMDRWFYTIEQVEDKRAKSVQRSAVLDVYNSIFRQLFALFDECWRTGNPESVMDFGRIFDGFKEKATDRFCGKSSTF